MGLQNLDKQVKAKLKNCKTVDELRENSVELTDDKVNMVSGGLGGANIDPKKDSFYVGYEKDFYFLAGGQQARKYEVSDN